MNILSFCKSIGITENQFYGKEKINGDLDLNSVTSIPEGFNPTVGGFLYLNSVTSIPECFNPTVGGSLYLKNKCIIINANIPFIDLQWDNGKYIKRDGIFTEVISHRGNNYRVRKINKKEIEYLITDGNGNWAHGSTLKEAKEDLIYKITDRKKSDYEHLKLNDVLTHSDAIKCYRVITGACSFGTRDFIENCLKEKAKKSYTIKEICELTKGQFGNRSFCNFFKF